MQIRLIQRLIALMQKGDVTELELEDSSAGLRVRLRRGPETPAAGSPVVHVTQAGGGPAPSPITLTSAQAAAAGPALASPGAPVAAEVAAPPQPAGTPFPSPMVGTFYRASSPEAEPYAQVGTTFGPDSTLCIIEAMKVMNEIKAESSGRVVQVLVQNGEPVEFGQPLFLVQPS
jgi:acetyl-CoA carboxylase biotin carboxyl carrier protein